jgi:anti-sigma factor RsiW
MIEARGNAEQREIAMVDHVWVEENLDTYLAGDHTTNDREKVERHVAGCEACTKALAEARRLEQVMNRLFADARPDAI